MFLPGEIPIADLIRNPDGGPIQVPILRSVKPCAILRSGSNNFNLFARDFWQANESWLMSCVTNQAICDCHFGDVNRPYRFGNLTVFNNIEAVTDWGQSSFFAVSGTAFTGRSQKGGSLDGLPVSQVDPIDDFQAYLAWRRASKYSPILLPHRLALRLVEVPDIFQWAPSQTLFSERAVAALRPLKHPGITFMDLTTEVIATG
jgi:hypothetical protein